MIALLIACAAEEETTDSASKACSIEAEFTATGDVRWESWRQMWSYDEDGHPLTERVVVEGEPYLDLVWTWEGACLTSRTELDPDGPIYRHDWSCDQPGVWDHEIYQDEEDGRVIRDSAVDAVLDADGHPRFLVATAVDDDDIEWTEEQLWSDDGPLWTDRRYDSSQSYESHTYSYDGAGRLVADVGWTSSDDEFRRSWSYDERGRLLQTDTSDLLGWITHTFAFDSDEDAYPTSSTGTWAESSGDVADVTGTWAWTCGASK